MQMLIVCDLCTKTAPAARPNKFFVVPDGWFVKGDRAVCSRGCAEATGEVGWKQVQRQIVKVGQANCKWCAKLGRVCPAHTPKDVAHG